MKKDGHLLLDALPKSLGSGICVRVKRQETSDLFSGLRSLKNHEESAQLTFSVPMMNEG